MSAVTKAWRSRSSSSSGSLPRPAGGDYNLIEVTKSEMLPVSRWTRYREIWGYWEFPVRAPGLGQNSRTGGKPGDGRYTTINLSTEFLE
ncbi:hypothetical protein ElyMa_001185900 [Elysia marginata]|uniref:Uncharacterized protein n=1 Tax=Elysia marginata TaxID=1093978 RepID=A0AAV4I6W5_9GAST|nr:hypothetical protein ElyMa_001185900 [Elysia marginata]